MSNAPIDIRFLQDEELPREDFPGGKGEVFRVFFTPEVHGALWKHAAENTSVEICGVLVGVWQRDADGPFVRITQSIRGESAKNKFAEVTFTHETWAKINAEMDGKHVGLSIVGWYHTHPDFGIFLSDRDRFIHEHFFSGPGQVAHVIDPIRKTEGVFVWREGKPSLAEHFWVGDRILLGTAAEKPKGTPASSGSPAQQRPGEEPKGSDSLLPPPGRMMFFLAFFLAGYMISGMRSSWERRLIEQGAFDRLVIWKGLRLGLGDHLDSLKREVDEASRAARSLEAGLSSDKADGKAREPASRDGSLRNLRSSLADASSHLDELKARYGYTREEEEMILGKARAEERARGRAQETATQPAEDVKTSGKENEKVSTGGERTKATDDPKARQP